MKGKLRQGPATGVVAMVTTGEAEMVINSIAPILAVPEAELVGWLPSELQLYVLFAGGVAADAQEAGAGKAFLDFLTTPEAVAVLKAKGLEPVMR